MCIFNSQQIFVFPPGAQWLSCDCVISTRQIQVGPSVNMYWSIVISLQRKDKKPCLWNTNSPCDDFIPTFYLTILKCHYVPRKTKAVRRCCLVCDGTERRRKQGPESLSPPENSDVVFPWCHQGRFPSSFTYFREPCLSPKTLPRPPLPRITRASGRKLHSIIKWVYVAHTSFQYVCVCTSQHKDTFRRRVKWRVAMCNPVWMTSLYLLQPLSLNPDERCFRWRNCLWFLTRACFSAKCPKQQTAEGYRIHLF